jgi:hypothetical protein
MDDNADKEGGSARSILFIPTDLFQQNLCYHIVRELENYTSSKYRKGNRTESLDLTRG